MNKILALFIITSLLVFVVGCTTPLDKSLNKSQRIPSENSNNNAETSGQNSETKNVDDLDQDLKSIDDDLGTEDLNGMNDELNETESLDY